MSPLPDPAVAVRAHAEAAYRESLDRLSRDTVRRVRDDLHGQPADLVRSVLLERLRGRLPAIEIDHAEVARLAWAIEHGRVRD
jgi:hypothetical protein